MQSATIKTSIFPEMDNSCYFLVVSERKKDGSDTASAENGHVLCRTPLGYRAGRQLAGLMTLKNFIQGGSDVTEGKVLACIKSIGARRKCGCISRFSYKMRKLL